MARVSLDRPRLAGLCVLALGAGACSLSAPTIAEYASVSSTAARPASAGAASVSGAAGQSQGEPSTEVKGAIGGGTAFTTDGGAADDPGSAGEHSVGGGFGVAGSASAAGGMSGAGGTGPAGESGNAGGVGTAGGGGTLGSPLCSDHPLSARSKWVASASQQFTPASSMLDGSSSRWSTGQAQSGNEWLQIDFGSTVSIRRINLQQGRYSNDYPRNYAVYVCDTTPDSSCARKRRRN